MENTGSRLETPAGRLSHVLTTPEVCALFRVSERTLRSWVQQRRLPAKKLGRSLYFNARAVLKALEEPEEAAP